MDNEMNVNNEQLGKEHRVRVLSPGMMVFKRFVRNKLAIIGVVTIVLMFLFSFIGGAVNPYTQSKVFYTTETMKKDYAGATIIEGVQMTLRDGVETPKDLNSKMILANTKNQTIFTCKDDSVFALGRVSDGIFFIYRVSEASVKANNYEEQLAEAEAIGSNLLDINGKTYVFDEEKNFYKTEEVGLGSNLTFTPYDASNKISYGFMHEVLLALHNDSAEFTVDGENYKLVVESANSIQVNTADGTEYAYISDMNINGVSSDVHLTPKFKQAVRDAIAQNAESFLYAEEGEEEVEYLLSNKNGEYSITRYKETKVIDTYAAPSLKHPFGTDANGMDLLARLMYGGRISLLIGFVVVFIEVFIGVIVGGIAGFFSGWVDNILMRFVDVVYCIPVMPLYLILGSVMDYYQVSATARIYLLCVIMSIVGWVGIARIVRGQILSLREQEFMIATEATGISIRRRIFRHLVPNVIPQLIVFASMGLGDIILTEATLSFLGLGIKYPAASWGSIINAVNDSYVMTNYWWVWIPAGFLILFTVLAFNFIGDGLRDAFDPKMKR